MPAPSAFGVTAESVRVAYFPHLDSFTANSIPSAVQMADFVTKSAAVLDGKLQQEALTASSITDTESSAYVWCADTIQLATAVRAIRSMTGQDPKVAGVWAQELRDRYRDLDDNGYLALGAGVNAPAQEAEGPSTHIDEYALEPDDPTDMSSILPPFRKDDLL